MPLSKRSSEEVAAVAQLLALFTKMKMVKMKYHNG